MHKWIGINQEACVSNLKFYDIPYPKPIFVEGHKLRYCQRFPFFMGVFLVLFYALFRANIFLSAFIFSSLAESRNGINMAPLKIGSQSWCFNVIILIMLKLCMNISLIKLTLCAGKVRYPISKWSATFFNMAESHVTELMAGKVLIIENNNMLTYSKRASFRKWVPNLLVLKSL